MDTVSVVTGLPIKLVVLVAVVITEVTITRVSAPVTVESRLKDGE